MSEKQPVMPPPRASNGTVYGKRRMEAWPFCRLWKVADSALFQMTLVTALLATVLGDCGPPPILSFASPVNELNDTEFKTGDVLRYTCRPGFSKTISNPTLICRSKGSWSYVTFCTRKRCRNPGDLPNGQVEVKTDFLFGSHIEFSCLEGYILVGSTTSYCEIQEKGVDWSDPLPECVIAQCESPPDISNGRHNGGDRDTYTFGSSVTYSCDPHFSLLGKASVSCTVENKTKGVWSPSPPVCKKITCSQPDIAHSKIVSGFGPVYTYKDSIVFNCQRGYILRGNSVIRCEVDNNWNPSPPYCELNGCIGLPDIPHAILEEYYRASGEEAYEIGTEFKYSCYSGYKPVTREPTTVVCQKNFRWNIHNKCEETCCPEPKLKNGVIIRHKKKYVGSKCTYFYGDEVSYSCSNKNYEASCRSDGTWYPEAPSCDKNCEFPPTIAHGHHRDVPRYIFGTKEYAYECDEGYTLVGESRISCSSSVWSALPPKCKAICHKPEIENGKPSVDKNQYVESENITVECNSGYDVVGSQSITCSEDRTWYPEVPKCEWVFPEGCEQVLAGRKLMQCLPNPEDVKMALEVYKLSLEIERLEQERGMARETRPTLESVPQSFFREWGKDVLLS